jgi:hypothetical protein
MLIRIALHGLSRAQGSSDLRLSGCSPNYQGLYESVESFEPPSAGALAALDPAELMSRVAPSNLVESMLEIEDALERLVECRTASNGSDSPDAAAAHEALLLREAFRELGRLERARGPGAGRGRASRFAELLSAAEETAGGLESRLRDSLGADDALRQVKQACVACHRGFRDR